MLEVSGSDSTYITPHDTPGQERSLNSPFAVARKGESDSRYTSRAKIRKEFSKNLAVENFSALSRKTFHHLNGHDFLCTFEKIKYFLKPKQSKAIPVVNRRRAKYSTQPAYMGMLYIAVSQQTYTPDNNLG